jgi:hypothetical protein
MPCTTAEASEREEQIRTKMKIVIPKVDLVGLTFLKPTRKIASRDGRPEQMKPRR